MLAVVLAVRFALELALLVVVAWWAWDRVGSWGGLALAAILVAAVAVAWGAVVSPRARLAVPSLVRIAVEVALFGAAALALVGLGRPAWGALLLAADVLVIAVLAWHGRRAGPGWSPSAAQRSLLPDPRRAP
jgi:hypothetical protein